MKGTCGKSCEGIYADVDTVDEKIENSNYDMMITKYKEYKRNYVKNIGFNSSVYKTDFGGLITAIIVKKNAFRGRATRVEVGGCPDLL